MTDSALAYLPEDRRHALAHGVDLPRRCTGSALFADISGFTPLTEALVRAYGPQRGAEQLLIELNRIYDSLVREVADRRGSVISYAGDAITCWFDDDPPGGTAAFGPDDGSAAARAVSSALALQRAMTAFASVAVGDDTVSLAVKVAVTSGRAVRAVVGDPEIQLIDTLAGDPVQRLATAEHEAQPGDVIVDEATAAALGDDLEISTWRSPGADTSPRGDMGPGPGDTSGAVERFAAVIGLRRDVPLVPWPVIDEAAIGVGTLRRWMIPPVATRLATGGGEFFTELRPAISLFMRFDGIDHDHDEDATSHLDQFVHATQRILERYDAYILQITIGDKGSYINTAFGAPNAYGDVAIRAISAALELRSLESPSVQSIQIGIAQGRTRTGACGATSRRCYGVMGDPVNVSARLMQRAADRQVLVEATVRRAAAVPFHWDDLAPISVKGKTQLIEVAVVRHRRVRNGNRLRGLSYALPMYGRSDQLALLRELLDRSLTGRGQVVGLVGDAGMGKSRLVSEMLGAAEERGFACLGGECQSFGINAAYHVWHAVWRDLFELDAMDPLAVQLSAVSAEIERIDPTSVERVPLLGAALNLQIPDTDLTASFDSALRKASLEALLVEVLRARVARGGPILLVIEDAHWLDPLSHDLLEVIARSVVDLPVVVVVAYRPPEATFLTAPRLSRLAHFTELRLDRISDVDIREFAVAKLRTLDPDGAPPAADLLDVICDRAEGNPFYVEELVNFLADRGVDPSSPDVLRDVQLPDSLHSLILGRIDQLSEEQRTLVKVASVIGRLFQAAMLWGVHRGDLGRDAMIAQLDQVASHDLTTLDSPEPDLAYLFKHVLTQEVAYETLPFASRAALHEQIAQFIEVHRADLIEQHLDLLAHHYDRTENLAKRREYLWRAGLVAQTSFANATSIDYFERLLGIVDGTDRIPTLLGLAAVLEVTSNWEAAEAAATEAHELAATAGAHAEMARAARTIGSIHRKRGGHRRAQDWMERSLASFTAAGDLAGRSLAAADIGELLRLQGRYAEALIQYDASLEFAASVADTDARREARAHALKGAGTVATWQGDYEAARRLNDESLALRRELGDIPGVAVLINNQGIIARFQQDLETARRLNDEALELFREIGDRWSTGQLLNNQACVAADLGRYDEALELLDECLEIRRRLGDLSGLNLSLITLADVLVDIGRTDEARPVLDESLALCLELEDRTMLAYLLEDLAGVHAANDRPTDALRTAGYAAAVRDRIGAPLPPNEQSRVDRLLASAHAALGGAATDALAVGAEFATREAIDELLAGT